MPLEAAACDSLVAVEKVGHRRQCGSATLNHSGKGLTLNVVLRDGEAKGVKDYTVPARFYVPHGTCIFNLRITKFRSVPQITNTRASFKKINKI